MKFKTFAILFLLPYILLCAAWIYAAPVTLSWEPSPSQGVGGYNAYAGNSSGNYTATTDVGNVLTYTFQLNDCTPYSFVVTAYSEDRTKESAYSNEVSTVTGNCPPPPPLPTTISFFEDKPAPPVNSGADSSVELGLRFQTTIPGEVTAIKFYKFPTSTGSHRVTLWSPTKAVLASLTPSSETSSGWQTVTLAAPITIQPNLTYTASYHTGVGRYPDDQSFSSNVEKNGLTAIAPGVYRYSTRRVFPASVYQISNYWVDIVFKPATTP